jgi:hypothetical protein
MTVEKKLERKLHTGMIFRGGQALKFSSPSFTGMPDRLCLMPGGKIWFVELKSTGKKPSPRQHVVHDWLQKLGFQVFVIDSEEKLQEFFSHVERN